MANFQHIPQMSGLSGLLQGAGQGLGAGIQELTSRKLGELRERETENRLYNTLLEAGYSPQQATVGKLLGQKGLERLLETAPEGNAQQQQSLSQRMNPQQQQQSQIQNLESLLAQSQKQTPQVGAFETAKEIGTTNLQSLLGKEGQQGQELAPINANDLINQARAAGLNPSSPEKWAQKIDQINQNAELRRAYEPLLQQLKQQAQQQPQQEMQQRQALLKKKLTEAEKQNLEFKTGKEAQRQKEHAFSQTEKIREAINERARSARDRKEDIALQRDLDESGKLDKAGYVEFLERAGLDIPALLSPESQLFQKTQQAYQRDAKALYGGNVSNFEVDQLLKGIPTLSSSKKGRMLLYPALDRFQDDQIAYQDAMKKIIKENNGIPPLDLNEQISDRIEPVMKRNAVKLRYQIKKIIEYVKDDENPVITALQATAGETVGGLKKAVPGALKGAVKGGIAGSFIPGLGTTGGAILGALGGGTGII